MKIIKLVGVFILLLLLANSLSWYFIGKEKAIFLNLHHFNQIDNFPQVDTLFVATGFYRESTLGPSRFIKIYDFTGFSESLTNEFLEKLSQSSKAKKNTIS